MLPHIQLKILIKIENLINFTYNKIINKNMSNYTYCIIAKFDNTLPKLNSRFNEVFNTTFKKNEICNVQMERNTKYEHYKCVITTNMCYYYNISDLSFDINKFATYSNYNTNDETKDYKLVSDIHYKIFKIGDVLHVTLNDIYIHDLVNNITYNMDYNIIESLPEPNFNECITIKYIEYEKQEACGFHYDDQSYDHDEYHIDIDEADIDYEGYNKYPNENTKEIYSDDEEEYLKYKSQVKNKTPITHIKNCNYMVNSIKIDELYNNNGFFAMALQRKLDKNFNVYGDYNLTFNIKNYHYSHIVNTRYFNEKTSVRCYMKQSGTSKYNNYICSCVNNIECKDYVYYSECPAFGYTGRNYVNCKCGNNIVNKLAEDWKYIYTIPYDILLVVMDNYGMCTSYQVKTTLNNKDIHIFSSAFSI